MAPDEILSLYAERGHLAYDGEGITQWQHAWQCGELARQAGAAPALQLAAWLHDLGHLLTGLTGTPTLRGLDDRHEDRAARALAPLFGPAVAQPVALHVLAKRWLVATRLGYREKLSPDSVRSLALQGGAMDEAECAAFQRQPFSDDALRLRAWDEVGKHPELHPPPEAVEALRTLMARVLPSA
jgi:phosphonate degradation associated HDIG domain protein